MDDSLHQLDQELEASRHLADHYYNQLVRVETFQKGMSRVRLPNSALARHVKEHVKIWEYDGTWSTINPPDTQTVVDICTEAGYKVVVTDADWRVRVAKLREQVRKWEKELTSILESN